MHAEYRPLTRLTPVTVTLLFATAALDLAVSVLDWHQVAHYPWLLDEGYRPTPSEAVLLHAFGWSAILLVVALVVTAVLFLVWMYRANGNARALGAQGLKFTPGWAVGYWFIPIMGLFRPYQAMQEIHRASDPYGAAGVWSQGPNSRYVDAWWGALILRGLVSRSSGLDAADPLAAAYVGLTTAALTVLAAVLASLVLSEVLQRQEEKARWLRAAGATAARPIDAAASEPGAPDRDAAGVAGA